MIFFLFQAEDGIRDGHVTGVQTCALPISAIGVSLWLLMRGSAEVYFDTAVMLIALLLAGRLVETLCRHRGLRSEERRVGKEGRYRRWPEGADTREERRQDGTR